MPVETEVEGDKAPLVIKVFSTKNRLPVELVYYEACLNQQDATHREKYLKTAWGKRYIKSRLKNYLPFMLRNEVQIAVLR